MDIYIYIILMYSSKTIGSFHIVYSHSLDVTETWMRWTFETVATVLHFRIEVK